MALLRGVQADWLRRAGSLRRVPVGTGAQSASARGVHVIRARRAVGTFGSGLGRGLNGRSARWKYGNHPRHGSDRVELPRRFESVWRATDPMSRPLTRAFGSRPALGRAPSLG